MARSRPRRSRQSCNRRAYRSSAGTACGISGATRRPAQIARDLGAVIDTYAARWGASKVALIGYSFGAGVLPFAYDRLPPEAKARVVQLSLLGSGSAADFEISMMGWLGAPPTENALPTKPALSPIDPSMIQCFYGRDEADSLCPSLAKYREDEKTRNHRDRWRPPFRRHLRRPRRTHPRRLSPPRRLKMPGAAAISRARSPTPGSGPVQSEVAQR